MISIDTKRKLIDFIPEEDEGKITLSFREFWDLVLEFKQIVRGEK